MQQSRLAAGVGHALALRINELLNADTLSAAKGKVAIEQATDHMKQTSPERFQAAQAMRRKRWPKILTMSRFRWPLPHS